MLGGRSGYEAKSSAGRPQSSVEAGYRTRQIGQIHYMYSASSRNVQKGSRHTTDRSLETRHFLSKQQQPRIALEQDL